MTDDDRLPEAPQEVLDAIQAAADSGDLDSVREQLTALRRALADRDPEAASTASAALVGTSSLTVRAIPGAMTFPGGPPATLGAGGTAEPTTLDVQSTDHITLTDEVHVELIRASRLPPAVRAWIERVQQHGPALANVGKVVATVIYKVLADDPGAPGTGEQP